MTHQTLAESLTEFLADLLRMVSLGPNTVRVRMGWEARSVTAVFPQTFQAIAAGDSAAID